MTRYYIGVDWGDEAHGIWASSEAGEQVFGRMVEQSVAGLSEWGRWLYEQRAAGIELWAAIEKPEGRIVDFLLDHEVVVYPVNPKAVDRARDRFRMSGAKSDLFDAYVLAEFVRTDHPHLHPLLPSSPQAQELKLLTRDYERWVRQQTRLVNQLSVTLKEYHPRALEMFGELTSPVALDFLQRYPAPDQLASLSEEEWQEFVAAHRLRRSKAQQLWDTMHQPQLAVPAYVVRAKSRLVQTLVAALRPVVQAVTDYRMEVERFFAALPAAEVASSLPGGETGTIVPSLWAELGDAPGRWASFQHLQAQGGAAPVTERSGKSHVVYFRSACNKRLRHATDLLAFASLRHSTWAKAYYRQQRARGHRHHHALRALASKWLKIIFIMWRDQVPYNEEHHLASIARHQILQPVR